MAFRTKGQILWHFGWSKFDWYLVSVSQSMLLTSLQTSACVCSCISFKTKSHLLHFQRKPNLARPKGRELQWQKHAKKGELKMLEIFNHIFCSVASTVLSKVFESLHKAGRNHRNSDCIPTNTVRGSHLSAVPQPFTSLNHWQQRGFDWGQLLQRKALHAWGLSNRQHRWSHSAARL